MAGFNKIIFIGNGKLMTDCISHTAQLGVCSLLCIDPEGKAFSSLASVCEKYKVALLPLTERRAINQFFASVSDPTLVLSIHNNHIFGTTALANTQLRFVNFHNSLLPKHPGRNAPSWAIYEGDKQTGITWHHIVREIDKGDVIHQAAVDIQPVHTGISLTRLCINLGLESFKGLLPKLLQDNYTTRPQQPSALVPMHYASDIPNNGILDASWEVPKISAFLRALDYGVYPVFPKARVFHNGGWHVVDKYKIAAAVAGAGNSNEKELSFTDNEHTITLTVSPANS